MKNIKKFTLGILGATILSLGLYACSNDDATTVNTTEQTTMVARGFDDITELALDEDFIEFVNLNLIDSETLHYNINLVNTILEDNVVTEDEIELVPIALGYSGMTSYKAGLGSKLNLLKKVDQKFELVRFTQGELIQAIDISIGHIDSTTLNDCKREKRNCYNIALATATLGHFACGGLDLTIVAGLACHGAVALAHVAMNDNCEIAYNRCIEK